MNQRHLQRPRLVRHRRRPRETHVQSAADISMRNQVQVEQVVECCWVWRAKGAEHGGARV
jgi:hypothetical protein